MAVKYLDDLHASGSIYFDEVATDGNVGSTTGYSMLVIEDNTSKVRSAAIPVGSSTPTLQQVTTVGASSSDFINLTGGIGVVDAGSVNEPGIFVNGDIQMYTDNDLLANVLRTEGNYYTDGDLVINIGDVDGEIGGSFISLNLGTDVMQLGGNARFFDNATVDGLLGVGTTSTVYKFHIVGDNTNNNTDSFVFENSNGSDSLKWSNAGQLELKTNNSNALIVKRSNGQAFVSLRNENTNGNNGYVQYLRSGTGMFSQGTYRDGSGDDYFGLNTNTSVNSSGNFIASFARADGQMTLHKYDSTTSISGTANKYLAVDTSGNVIPVDVPTGGGGSSDLQDVLDEGNVAASTSFLVEDASGFFIDFSRAVSDQLGIEVGEIYMSAENTIWQYGTKVQIGGNSIVTETDSNLIGVGKGTTGATYSMRFQNSDKSEYVDFNDAGRMQLYSSNSIPLIIGRPNGNAVLQFRNDANEGSITYFGNGTAKWGAGVIQKTSTDFLYTIAASTGTSDLPTMDTVMTMTQAGSLQLQKYGNGTKTGSPSYLLAVDSGGNVIESTQSIPNLEKGVTTTTTSSSGNVVLSHSLGDTPSGVSIQMTAAIVGGFSTPHAIATVTARTSSNITINFKDGRGASVNSTSVSFSYILIA